MGPKKQLRVWAEVSTHGGCLTLCLYRTPSKGRTLSGSSSSVVSESDRRLISQFADHSGRAQRPVQLNPETLKARSAKKPFWRSVGIWWATYLVLAIAVSGDEGTSDLAYAAAFTTATFVAVAYLVVWNARGRKSRKLAQQWNTARLAQAKLDGDLFDNTLSEQLGYPANLAKSHDETLKGDDFGLRGILMPDPRDNDAHRPALHLTAPY